MRASERERDLPFTNKAAIAKSQIYINIKLAIEILEFGCTKLGYERYLAG